EVFGQRFGPVGACSSEAHHDRIALRNAQNPLALETMSAECAVVASPGPPVGAVPFTALVCGAGAAALVDPTLGKDPFTLPDPVAKREQTEPAPVAKGHERVGRP